MIVVLKDDCRQEQVREIERQIRETGCFAIQLLGTTRPVIAVVSHQRKLLAGARELIRTLDHVDLVLPVEMKERKGPSVFICYAKEDREQAESIATFLDRAGADPWLDKRKLVLGDDWEAEIKKAVMGSDAFVVCLRPEFQKVGFRHNEVRWALDAWRARPSGRGFLIPFITEPCDLPEWCRPIHAGPDLGKRTELIDLVRAIEKHCVVQLSPPA